MGGRASFSQLGDPEPPTSSTLLLRLSIIPRNPSQPMRAHERGEMSASCDDDCVDGGGRRVSEPGWWRTQGNMKQQLRNKQKKMRSGSGDGDGRRRWPDDGDGPMEPYHEPQGSPRGPRNHPNVKEKEQNMSSQLSVLPGQTFSHEPGLSNLWRMIQVG